MTLPVPTPTTPATRRTVLTGAAALTAAGFVASAAPPAQAGGRPSGRVTVLGTTDLHGNVLNWDYFANREFENRTKDDIGVAKVATLVKSVRAERAGEPIITLDAGDTLQGTPLAYYYARIDPITNGAVHPMAAAMNLVGYDAAALGNHEFNYGIDILCAFESQLDFSLLGANAVDAASGLPAFPPYITRTVRLENGPRLTIGVLGLTNPGIAIWDKANVEARMVFPGLVEQARVYVPRMKEAGCDIVVTAAHSGADTSSSYGDALPYPENAATLGAEQVPGVDGILVGHAHREIPQRYVTNQQTGYQVLLTEPRYWGMRLSVMDFAVQLRRGRWQVTSATSQVLNSNSSPRTPLSRRRCATSTRSSSTTSTR